MGRIPALPFSSEKTITLELPNPIMSNPLPQNPSREELKKLPRNALAVYAMRCAQRAFPFLGIKGHFNFWKDQTQYRLSSIDAATICWAVVGDDAYAVNAVNAANAANDAANDANDDAAYDAAYAAAAAAAYSADAYAAAAAAADAYAAAAAAYADDAYDDAAGGGGGAVRYANRVDFESLKRIAQNNEPREAYYSLIANPLLPKETLEAAEPVYQEILSRWDTEAIRSIPIATELISDYRRYLFEGGFNKEEATRRFEKWQELHEAESTHQKTTKPRKKTASKKGNEKPNPKREPKETPETQSFSTGNTPSLHGDIPTGTDLLQREWITQPLAHMLGDPDQATPFNIALFGHWGVGKSSIKQSLIEQLSTGEYKGRLLFADFNAWEYEHTDNIRAGLAQEVVDGLIHEYENGNKKKLGFSERFSLHRKYATKNHASAFFKGLVLFTMTIAALYWADWSWFSDIKYYTIGGVTLSALWLAMQEFWNHPLRTELHTYLKLPKFKQHLGYIPVIKKQLQDLCELRLSTFTKKNNTGKRLVVFIDDLDRCKFECIRETFDAARLITDFPNVIVIFLVDERIALRAMEKTYEDFHKDGEKGRTAAHIARDYLNKIVQLPIAVPHPDSERIDRYLDEALFTNVVTNEQEAMDILKKNTVPTSKSATVSDPVENKKKPADTTTTAIGNNRPKKESKPNPINTTVESRGTTRDIDYAQAMHDTPTDRMLFGQLVKTLDMTNPRQLKKLHNSFRFLRAMIEERVKKGLTSNLPEGQERHNLILAGLFWEEHQANFENPEKLNTIQENILRNAGEQEPLLLLSNTLQKFKDREYQPLRELIRMCILPNVNLVRGESLPPVDDG